MVTTLLMCTHLLQEETTHGAEKTAVAGNPTFSPPARSNQPSKCLLAESVGYGGPLFEMGPCTFLCPGLLDDGVQKEDLMQASRHLIFPQP